MTREQELRDIAERIYSGQADAAMAKRIIGIADELEALKAREPMTDEQRSLFIVEHFGPHALAGDRMSIWDVIHKTIDQVEAHHKITSKE